ncbi:hypothetical protein [Sulfurisoma sediminicola]|uniref:hypothetical protein n=1 Tax=Sulfurisoma sediminicola TaxID=1381557 RepID=UPI000F609CE0|nr:hypothetical protein [Sulfurisoma sediminicola]
MPEEMDRGWRDPVLMEGFIAIVEQRSGELRLSPRHATTVDELAFDAIMATGAIEWEGQEQYTGAGAMRRVRDSAETALLKGRQR